MKYLVKNLVFIQILQQHTVEGKPNTNNICTDDVRNHAYKHVTPRCTTFTETLISKFNAH